MSKTGRQPDTGKCRAAAATQVTHHLALAEALLLREAASVSVIPIAEGETWKVRRRPQ